MENQSALFDKVAEYCAKPESTKKLLNCIDSLCEAYVAAREAHDEVLTDLIGAAKTYCLSRIS